MYIRRNLKKLILASVVVDGLTFTEEIYNVVAVLHC